MNIIIKFSQQFSKKEGLDFSVKGYQKRVIYLKNTGSHIFDEALFFVRTEGDAVNTDHNDMVNEANRIIDESLGKVDTKGRGGRRFLAFIVPFLLGILVCSVAAILIVVF